MPRRPRPPRIHRRIGVFAATIKGKILYFCFSLLDLCRQKLFRCLSGLTSISSDLSGHFFYPTLFFWFPSSSTSVFTAPTPKSLPSSHGCGNSFPEKTERARGAMKGSVHIGPGETIQRSCDSLPADNRYHDDILVSG